MKSFLYFICHVCQHVDIFKFKSWCVRFFSFYKCALPVFFFLVTVFFLYRGQCKDQRRRPMCLWGACGEDPPDSWALGEWTPRSEAPSGGPGSGQWQGMWRILFHTLKVDRTKKNTNRIGMTTDQKQRGREGEVGLDEFLKANCWSSSVSRKDFAVCTLPFQPSSVTCHYFLFKTRMKGL